MEENSINKPLSKWRKLNDDDKAKYFAVVMKVNEFCQAHDIEIKRNTYYRFKLNKKNYLVTHDRFIYQLVNQLKDKIEDEKTIAPAGNVTYKENVESNDNNQKNIIGEKILGIVTKIVFAVVLYALFTFFAPKFTEKLADYISNKSLKTILYGLLGVIAIPFASILLMVTVIGLPLAFVLLGLYVMIFVLSTTITVFAVSNKIAGMIKLDKNIWTKMLTVALVVVMLYLLKLIPIVSSLVSIVVVLLGFGIIISNIIEKNN